MQPSGKRWIIGICIGMCITALIYIGISRNRSYREKARLANALGTDTESFIKLTEMNKKAGTQHTLSTEELQEVGRLLKSPSRNIRLRAMEILQFCTDPAVKPTSITLLKTMVDDKEPLLRSLALRALLRKKDPDVLASAQKQSEDVDPNVRKQAADLLKGKDILN